MKNIKNNNAITINVNDDIKKDIDFIAAHYQRKPAELLRLLLEPVILNEFAQIMTQTHADNKNVMQRATFKKD